MNSKSISGKSTKDIKKKLENSITSDFKPTVAIVFMSVKQNRKAICELMDSKNIQVFGATSCGEFINGHQTEGEIAILLLELSKDHFTILFEDIEGENVETAATKLATKALAKFTNPSLIVCSPGINQKGEHFEGEKLVKYLVNSLAQTKHSLAVWQATIGL